MSVPIVRRSLSCLASWSCFTYGPCFIGDCNQAAPPATTPDTLALVGTTAVEMAAATATADMVDMVGSVETQLTGRGDNRPMQYMPPIALGRG